ncbi:MAG: extracellular solute-binding protein [Patescibacteria group bacterium]
MDLGTFANSRRVLYILVAGIVLLVFLTVILIVRSFGDRNADRAVLRFWGVFDLPAAFEQVVREFEGLHPNIRIEYSQMSYEDYESSVISALAAGTGPDVWMIHNTWLPKHADKLRPMPNEVLSQQGMTTREFQDAFVEVAYADLVRNDGIYALPLYIDTLGLYYNRDLFNAAGIASPPRTWKEFQDVVARLTKFDQSNNIIQSGAAIGSARNINRSTDILMSLMLQSGVQMTDPGGTSATFSRSVDNQRVGDNVLQFYTDFTNPSKVVYCWNDDQHYSIDAFIEGTTAMMFNYAHQQDVLRTRASRLNFAVAPIPQPTLDDVRTYASYWAPAVSAASLYPEQAWAFVQYLASRQGALAYLNTARRPAARRDLIELQRNDADLGIFAVQALAARSWYQADSQAIETIFADMIDDVNFSRASIQDALERAENRVSTLMNR